MSSANRPDAVHVDIIGDKNGAPRVQTLGTASILGILPEGHVWTIRRANGEAECCGTFHVDVERQTTHIRCASSGHTILSGRGLVKALQMMADMGNAPVIVSHDPGVSSTIKNAEYTPSGEFAPVAPVEGDLYDAMVSTARDAIKENGRVFVAEAHNWGGEAAFDALVASGWATLVDDGDMSRYIRTMRTADRIVITDGLAVWDYNLTPGRVVLSTAVGDGWFNVETINGGRSLMNGERVTTRHPRTRQAAGDVVAAMTGSFGQTVETPVPPINSGIAHTFQPKSEGFEGGPSYCVAPCHGHVSMPFHVTEAEVWAGTGTLIKLPIRTNLGKRKRKANKVNARRVRGGF